ncbi:MAG: hypothetical protein HZA13_08615 [Nitrospirae bacterium]|nr:hypothetical protein [Nitrospirota bacterium]
MNTHKAAVSTVDSGTIHLFEWSEALAGTDLESWNLLPKGVFTEDRDKVHKTFYIGGHIFRPEFGNVIFPQKGYASSQLAIVPQYLIDILQSQSKPEIQSTAWTRVPQRKYQDIDRSGCLENSTVKEELPEDLDQKIKTLFELAEGEDFEFGMESNFSEELNFLVQKYGNAAMEIIANLIIYEKASVKVSSEALRLLGHISHIPSHRFRLWLLENRLNSSYVNVRDGAALGLANLDDPHAIPYLKKSIEQEPKIDLRKDMEKVLAQLEDMRNAVSFQKDRQQAKMG